MSPEIRSGRALRSPFVGQPVTWVNEDDSPHQITIVGMKERSPILHTDKLSCPMIFFQGLDDKVVPPDQTEKMVNALRMQGIPVAYVPLAGESQGFRRAENIRRALEAELYFYSRVFGFTPADAIEHR